MSIKEFTFVVVGGGIAGVSCIEQLAFVCQNDESILLITSSPVVKIATNLKHITDSLTEFDLKEADAASWSKRFKKLQVMYGAVKKLDMKSKVLEINDGPLIKFGKVCICAGGTPKSPFLSNPCVITIRDTESIERLQNIVQSSRRIVVIGNGGIATELVQELQNVEVIWSVKDKSITHKFLDAGAAEFLIKKMATSHIQTNEDVTKHQRYSIPGGGSSSTFGVAMGPDWHKNVLLKGNSSNRKLEIEFETEVSAILPPSGVSDDKKNGSWPVFVLLTNGKLFGCDVVISATGVKPNSGIWTGDNPDLQVAADGGLLVDDNMMTSVQEVYAAGDVCTAGWDPAPHWLQMRLWTQARQMGAFAGKCMYHHYHHPGDKLPQDFCFEVFTHVTKFFNTKVILLGLFNGQNLDTSSYHLLVRVNPGIEYIKVVIKEGRMQGAVLLGETGLEETFENLIMNQIDLSQYGDDLLNPAVDIEDYFD